MSYTHSTEEEQCQIYELRKEGYTLEAIGQSLGRSKSTISRHVHRRVIHTHAHRMMTVIIPIIAMRKSWVSIATNIPTKRWSTAIGTNTTIIINTKNH